MAVVPLPLTPDEALRFVNKIVVNDRGCWIWTAGKTSGRCAATRTGVKMIDQRVRTPPPLPAPTQPIVRFAGPYRFLSNFSPAAVTALFAGPERTIAASVPTVEHAYQAMKCRHEEQFNLIRRAATPALAKRLGRSVVLVEDWDQCRIAVMRNLIAEKFQFPALAQALCATGTVELIEGNTWGDRFWGMVITTGGSPTGTPCWEGENWLGRLLMERRAVLQKERERGSK